MTQRENASTALEHLLDRVARGEDIVVERGGKDAAVLMSAETCRVLRAFVESVARSSKSAAEALKTVNGSVATDDFVESLEAVKAVAESFAEDYEDGTEATEILNSEDGTRPWEEVKRGLGL